MAPDRAQRDAVAEPFRTYYEGTAALRERFLTYLAQDEQHHVFLASDAAVEEEAEEATDDPGDSPVPWEGTLAKSSDDTRP